MFQFDDRRRDWSHSLIELQAIVVVDYPCATKLNFYNRNKWFYISKKGNIQRWPKIGMYTTRTAQEEEIYIP